MGLEVVVMMQRLQTQILVMGLEVVVMMQRLQTQILVKIVMIVVRWVYEIELQGIVMFAAVLQV